jgi:hypothetical protein
MNIHVCIRSFIGIIEKEETKQYLTMDHESSYKFAKIAYYMYKDDLVFVSGSLCQLDPELTRHQNGIAVVLQTCVIPTL